MDASETMNMFELNGKQIRVGRAMFPPSQIINDGPETHFERTSAAMVKYMSAYVIENLFKYFRLLNITMEIMNLEKQLLHLVW